MALLWQCLKDSARHWETGKRKQQGSGPSKWGVRQAIAAAMWAKGKERTDSIDSTWPMALRLAGGG